MQGAFSPDGRCFALCMKDGGVTLYEIATGQPRRTFGHKLPLAGNDDPLDDYYAALLGLLPARSGEKFAFSPNGRLLALAGPDGTVPVLDVWTGKEMALFQGHTGVVNSLVFAPNGKTLVSASADTTALLWDVSKLKGLAAPARAPTPGDLEAWWQALAAQDGVKAFAAMGDFLAAPKQTVAFLQEQVKPATPPDQKRIAELFAQLENKQYKVREKTTTELLKVGDLLVPFLEKALAANPPQESKRRLEFLRAQLTGLVLQGERLRGYRAVEILERIGTPEARQVLQALAGGAPESLVTASAASRRP